MQILIIGFGPLARNLTDKIKRFPEYDPNGVMSIYHIFTRRNSLSYGSDLVVEIPDPHGDGYRTYKDGLQAVDKYATTVSNYVPWLMEEAKNGSFHIVIDCTNRTPESETFILELVSISKNELIVIPANIIGIQETINMLRDLVDGGKSWTPVTFDKVFLDKANSLWDAARKTMFQYHQINRLKDIANRGNPNGASSTSEYSIFSVIPKIDRPLIDRFIVEGDSKSSRGRIETVDESKKILIIDHELLTSFFGWHHTEQIASWQFLDPKLEIESARYIKYLSDECEHISEAESDYVIEYVHKGKMTVVTADGSNSIDLIGDSDQSSFSYRPKVNKPHRRKVHAGLETIIFTYKRMKDAS
jgi:hypothetical protein